MTPRVAALYIDPRGPYPKLLGPEMCWDEQRDARTYAGPWPVVAHPPCGPWGRLSQFCTRQDARLGPIAIDQVRSFGGVLEHPEFSRLFRECNAPHPGEFPDAFGGRTVEVDQVSWGHSARKRTWLYFVGIDRALVLAGLRLGGTPTHWVSGGRLHDRKGSGGVVPPGIKVCSAQQRRRTPVAFAEWLISLAATARRAA